MVIHARNFVTSDDALGGAVIQRSVRFNSNDSTQIENTNLGTSPTSRKIATISFWFKRSKLSDSGMITMGYSGTGASASGFAIRFKSSHQLGVENQINNSLVWDIKPTRVFRDVASWYHIVTAIDTTQGTSSDRVKFYINGVQETDLETTSYPSQNYDNLFNYNKVRIGAWDGNGYYNGFDGYIADFYSIDGQALDPSYFGYTESQTGLWRPKRYEGTFGNNGHHLDFRDNSSASNLGLDRSGNSKDFNNVSNISVSDGTGNDSLEDTPTNNFPTFNHINSIVRENSYDAQIRQGGLLMVGGDVHASTTINLPKSGKWYVEFSKYGNGAPQAISVTRANKLMTSYDGALGLADHVQYVSNGEIGNRTRGSTSDAPTWQDDADIVVAAAVDMDNGAVYFARANTWINSGDPTSGSAKTGAIATDLLTDNDGEHYIGAQGYNGNNSYGMYINFGQRPFTYTPPTGYKTLSSKNLPLNTPSIIRPQKHFETLLYTGTGSSNIVEGLEFSPDMIWVKGRDTNGYEHMIIDSVRGGTKSLVPNANDQESTHGGRSMTFYNRGVRWNSDSGNCNANGEDYVMWCWKAGGSSTVSNTDGDQTTQVSLNEEAGFGIVTYTGTGSNTNIGHGLGAVPEMIITKSRSASGDWAVLDKFNTTAEYGFFLNDNGGYSSYQGGTFWNDTPPTSTVFRVSTNSATNASGVTYVAYCWKSIPGFSKIGKYTGNGNSNGAFVHLGFRPAWVMFKRTNSGGNWFIVDNKRDPFNECTRDLYPNNANAETNNANFVDFLSNGFKLRTTGTAVNASGGTYIYMAFAEQPGNTAFDTITNAR